MPEKLDTLEQAVLDRVRGYVFDQEIQPELCLSMALLYKKNGVVKEDTELLASIQDKNTFVCVFHLLYLRYSISQSTSYRAQLCQEFTISYKRYRF